MWWYRFVGIILGAAALPTAAEATAPLRQDRPPEIVFERIDSRDGLSHNTVFTIYQDGDGYLWVGTLDGLNRYDGYEFVFFPSTALDDAARPGNTIRALASDRFGILWAGTSRGIAYVDRDHTTLYPSNPVPFPLALSDIHELVSDQQDNLWIVSDGLMRYNPHSGEYRSFDRELDEIFGPNYRIRSVQIMADGTLLLHVHEDASSYVLRHDPEGDRFRIAASLTFGDAKTGTAFLGKTGLLWLIGAELSTTGEWGRGTRAVPALPAGSDPTRFLEDRYGNLWMGTDNGVYLFDGSNEDLSFVNIDPSETGSLGNHVWSLFEDAGGSIWVGTRHGLYRYDRYRKPFLQSARRHGWEAWSRFSPVSAVLESEKGDVWLGTLGRGLFRLDGNNSRDPPGLAPEIDGNSLGNVWSLMEHPGGNIWVGSEQGIHIIEPASGRIFVVEVPDYIRHPTRSIFHFAPGPAGFIWAAGIEDLLLMDPERRVVAARYPARLSPSFSTVQAMYTGENGVLWMGTEGDGLYRFLPGSDGKTEQVRDAAGHALAETVWCIHGDRSGDLWLGTDHGLIRFNPVSQEYEAFPIQSEAGAIAYSILEADDGDLWIGTSRGLVRFSPQSGAFRVYAAEDDRIENVEFNRRAAARTRGGVFLFGGMQGITAFHPSEIVANPQSPPVVITRIHRSAAEGESTIESPAARRGMPRFRSSDASITFEFAALSYDSPGRHSYRYMLEGKDRGWVESGRIRRARYAGLSPGSYTFRVVAGSPDGSWSEEGASVSIYVAPLFRQTIWFKSAIILLLALTAWGGYRYRINQLLKLDRMRFRIASDLHDEVGSKLSSIALASDLIRDTPRVTEKDKEMLERISTVSRGLVENIRDMVWFIDPEHDQPGALAARMKRMATELLTSHTVTFEILNPEALDAASMVLRRHLYLIYVESLHNIARHARAKTVRISIHVIRGVLEMDIHDDGAGFEPGRIPAGFGLKAMRKRAHVIGAALTVHSEPGAGTHVHLAGRIT